MSIVVAEKYNTEINKILKTDYDKKVLDEKLS